MKGVHAWRRVTVAMLAIVLGTVAFPAGASTEGPGGSVDGSVTVSALVVTAITPPATPPAAGDLVAVRVQVRNDLPRSVASLTVGIVGAVSVGTTVAPVAAGQTAEVAVPVWFCVAGPTTISATASGLDTVTPVAAAPGQSTVAVGAGPGCPDDPAVDRFPIRVSTAADRSNPVPLDGRIVNGIAYVFVDPANPALVGTRINRVEFRLDGGRMTTDSTPPFDLAGTSGSRGRPARGLDTTVLADGTHTIVFTVRFRGGSTQRSTATFIVDNGALAKSIRYSSSPQRSASLPLDGSSLTGRQVYIYVGPTDRIIGASVRFRRNGRVNRVESQAPYDFAGTARNGDARPFTLTGLRRGTHTVTIEFRLPGGVTVTQKASFTRP